MTGWPKKIAAVLATLALALPSAAQQAPAQISNAPQGGYTLKLNSDLVLTNVVVRDAKTGAYTQFPQQGTLLIEDDVEIGANSTIDRGALKQTRIGRGTKIDNLVHVGHNCDIGEDVILVMGTGISGSSTVGNGAVIAGQVGIGDHVTIGPGVILGGQAGVFSGSKLTNEGVKPGTVFYGTPARPLRQVLREQATLARLAKKPKPTAGE